MRSLFLSPHSDDECLFGAFTIQKHKPTVVICFGSTRDYGDDAVRMSESATACWILGVDCLTLPPGCGIDEGLLKMDRAYAPHCVWAPSAFAMHRDHVHLAEAASSVFGDRVRRYDTYHEDAYGMPEKSRAILPSSVDDPIWVQRKLRALSCYESQIRHPRAKQFFEWDLYEYAEQP